MALWRFRVSKSCFYVLKPPWILTLGKLIDTMKLPAPLSVILAMVLFQVATGHAQNSPDAPVRVEADVLRDANQPGGTKFWVVLKEQANVQGARAVPNWTDRGAFVHNRLRSVAGVTQDRIRTLLRLKGVRHKPFWIVNAIQVEGDGALLKQIATLPEVREIIGDRVLSIPKPQLAAAIPSTGGVEWNIRRINAPLVWSNYLATGEGVVVCNIDTGVQFDHPALVNQYRGKTPEGFQHDYNWFEPASPSALPYPHDDGGHGTHTMGTMVGGTGPSDIMGVAPGAKWIAAKACAGQTCDFAALLACAEWVLAPTDLNGNNPMPGLRPNIVNNSWGLPFSDPWFRGVVQQWVAAGIFPVFSGGNDGQYGCFTVMSPADYPESYAVGGFDYDNNLSWFSSMGPAINGLTKPNITAPGSDIRSAFPGNAFAVSSGTSMAAPHVAGAVALLWSAAPTLKGNIELTRQLLDRSAIDAPGQSCGGYPTNNTMFGEGFLDVSLAVAQAPLGAASTLSGFVSNAVTAEPITNAQVLVLGPATGTAVTADNGMYAFPSLPAGTYEIVVTAFGFFPQTNQNIVVDGAALFDAVLNPSALMFTLSGHVRDGAAQPIEGAKVTMQPGTNAPVYTAADGSYTLGALPEGVYTITVDSTCCYDSGTRSINLTNNLSDVDFTFAAHTDLYGYRCTVVEPDYMEAGYSLGLSGDDFYVITNLPFAFPFYGKVYTNINIYCDGYVSFGPGIPDYLNQIIPSAMFPNGAIYVFWDDLYVQATNTIRIATNGASPNMQYIVEWRGVYLRDTTNQVDFQVILEESGRILCQYRNIPDTFRTRGGGATLGIENENGSLGLLFAANQPVLEPPAYAIEYWPAPAARLIGQVKDAGDGLPIPLAQVELTQDGRTRRIGTDQEGRYDVQVPLGAANVRASAYNYSSVTNDLVIANQGGTNIQNFSLETGTIGISSSELQVSVAQGYARVFSVILTNTGSQPLEWSLSQAGGAQVAKVPERQRNPLADPNAVDARGVFLGAEVTGWPARKGDVLGSWPAQGAAMAWGITGISNYIAVTDAGVYSNQALPDIHHFTRDGLPLGTFNATNNGWLADLTYDSTHRLLCQLMVGGTAPYTNSILCSDPANGNAITNITGPWAATSQRGLAYRPDNDTFYVGGWNQGVIYNIKGLSWDEPGAILSQFSPFPQSIAGLAWNASENVLWMASNETLDRMYALDPTDGTILATLAHPYPGYNGAGLECDLSGRLWAAGTMSNRVYLIDSGIPSFTPVAWLEPSLTNGTIAPGATQQVDILVNGDGLSVGDYIATLFIHNSGGRNPQALLPVHTRVFEESTFVTGVTPGSLRNDYAGWVGMRFVTGAKAVNVTSLGRYVAPGNIGIHAVRLVRASDSQLIATAQVDTTMGTAGQFLYGRLSTSVQLAANTAYYLVSQEQGGGDLWHQSNTALITSSVAEVTTAAYSSSAVTFYHYAPGQNSYGPVDFTYEVVPALPRLLTILSSTPEAGVTVQVIPADQNSETSGATPFTRTYLDESTVQVSAPTVLDGFRFDRWESAGVPVSSNASLAITLTNDVELTAVYAPFLFPPVQFVQSLTPGTTRNDFNGYVGFRFRTGPTPLTVMSLGRWRVEGNNQQHLVKLVKASNSTDVTNGWVVIDGSLGVAGQMHYAGLPEPVVLERDTEYHLVSREFLNGDLWLECNTTITTSEAGQPLSGAYSFGNNPPYYYYCAPGHSYVGVDFKHAPMAHVSISALNPEGPVPVSLMPADALGVAGGPAPLELSYNSGTAVTLTVPATTGTNKFLKWQVNGTDVSVLPEVTFGVETNTALTAVYAPERPLSISSQLGTLRNNFSGSVGARLMVGAKPIRVTALGRMKAPGNSGSHLMKIVRETDSEPVPGSVTNVLMSNGVEGQFVYQVLEVPVVLQPGEVYFIVTAEVSGGEAWYNCDSTLTTTTAAQVLGGIYAFGTSKTYYRFCEAGHSYGPVDIRYEGVPEWELTVTSSNALPASIAITPADNNNLFSGQPTFTRSYCDGTAVTLTAPASQDGKLFATWLVDGTFLSTNRVVALTVDKSMSLVAVYDDLPVTVTNFVASVTLGTPRNDFGSWVGMRVTVGPEALMVTSLGRMIAPGNSGTHAIKIVRASDGQDLPGAEVVVHTSAATPGEFKYSALPAPVMLAPGAVYYVLSKETSGGDTWYDVNTSLMSQPAGTIDSGAYGYHSGAWYAYGTVGRSYVPVDFKYYLPGAP